jgi:hypothetical protein
VGKGNKIKFELKVNVSKRINLLTYDKMGFFELKIVAILGRRPEFWAD